MNLLRREEVERRTGLKRSTLYRFVQQGRFPAPVKLGESAVAWADTEVDAWIKERLAERDSAGASQ